MLLIGGVPFIFSQLLSAYFMLPYLSYFLISLIFLLVFLTPFLLCISSLCNLFFILSWGSIENTFLLFRR